MVVMKPLCTPNLSCSTFTTGAMQLVVQEALEMTLCFFGSYLSSFTPNTTVQSSFLAGGGVVTFFGASLEVGGRLLGVGEEPRALDHDLYAKVAPGDLCRVPLGQHLDGLAVHHDGVVPRLDLGREYSIVAVVLQKVG